MQLSWQIPAAELNALGPRAAQTALRGTMAPRVSDTRMTSSSTISCPFEYRLRRNAPDHRWRILTAILLPRVMVPGSSFVIPVPSWPDSPARSPNVLGRDKGVPGPRDRRRSIRRREPIRDEPESASGPDPGRSPGRQLRMVFVSPGAGSPDSVLNFCSAHRCVGFRPQRRSWTTYLVHSGREPRARW